MVTASLPGRGCSWGLQFSLPVLAMDVELMADPERVRAVSAGTRSQQPMDTCMRLMSGKVSLR